MANFDLEFEKLIEREGYLSNDPMDSGGETIYGISSRWFPEVVSKLRSMPQAEALKQVRKFYQQELWEKLNLNEINSQEIAGKIFDMAVNSDPRDAVMNVQKALNFLGCQLLLDGLIGIKTVAAINLYRHQDVVSKWFTYYRMQHIEKTVNANAKNSRFIPGWTRRA